MAVTSHKFHQRCKQLQAFCYVAQTGSMSRAAERMFLSQPSISLLIKALEENLGAQLFERKGPKILVSPKGKILLDLALPLMEGLEALPKTFIDRCADETSGELVLAVSEPVSLYVLPDILKKFAVRFPRIQIKLLELSSAGIVKSLRANQVELAISSLFDVPNDIDYLPLRSCTPHLIYPPMHPLCDAAQITLEHICRHELLLPPVDSPMRRLVDLVFSQNGLTYDVSMETSNLEVIKRYVALGFGVSIVDGLCLTDAEPFLVYPLDEDFPRISYGVLRRAGGQLSPPGKHFIALLHETEANVV